MSNRKKAKMSSAASKKQLDDKHQKILRKLLQLPENKKCFDCSEKVRIAIHLHPYYPDLRTFWVP